MRFNVRFLLDILLDIWKNVTPAPDFWKGEAVDKIMYRTLHGFLFAAGAAVFFFGLRALLVMAVSVAVTQLTDYVFIILRKRPLTWPDGSAILTGLILSFMLPPTIPLWIVVIGAVFSIAVVKEAFGGLGRNIFNPAAGARFFMTAMFMEPMTTWVWPHGVNALATATPLAEGFVLPPPNEMIYLYRDMFLGNIGGSMGETSALFVMLGGLFLIVWNIIDWKVPLAMIGTVALIMAVAPGQSPIFHVLAGGLMLGAFFMATDYATIPVTAKGRILFAIGAGIVTVLIRLLLPIEGVGPPEGVVIAILMMNAITPLIDRYIKVRPYGLREEIAQIFEELKEDAITLFTNRGKA